MAICELTGVSKRYPLGDQEVLAVNKVTLSIQEGEFTAFAGPSGSGKTTLLNMVGCLDTVSEGTVLLDGQDLSALSQAELGELRAHKIGFVFQSFNLIPVLSALENVEIALRLGGKPASREQCVAALQEVGLGEYLDRRPNQLSGGQQQRVAIARALVKKPRLIIADEPTANLDSKTGEQVLDLMHSLNQAHGTTFLFSTHDPMVLERAERVIWLRDGQVTRDEMRS